MHSPTAGRVAGDLRNNGPHKSQLRMAHAEFNQRLCHLLERGDADVSHETPVHSFRLIEVDDLFDEIGTIAGKNVKVGAVR